MTEYIVFPLTPQEQELAKRLQERLEGAKPFFTEVMDDALGFVLAAAFVVGLLIAAMHQWLPVFAFVCRDHGSVVGLIAVAVIVLADLVFATREWLGYYRPRQQLNLAEFEQLLTDPLIPGLRLKYKNMAATRAVLADQSRAAQALLNPTHIEDRTLTRLLTLPNTK